jgi:hypothetical protein
MACPSFRSTTARLPRPVAAVVGGLALLLLAGCRDDEIRHYRVPRTEPPPTRLLAAILPAGEKVWFVSVSGPAPAVAALQPAFDQFVQTIRFPEDERRRITWTLPADWQRERSREKMRYATFRAGPNALEVKVHAFGQESAGVLANVNRWRGQIGLDPITEAELPQVARPLTVNGVAGTAVDMTGPGANARQLAPAAAAEKSEPPAPGGGPLAYDTPPGWLPLPVPPGGMRVAAFKVADGDRAAEVTVIPLAGPAGGLLANVNRWRKQIGLGEITDDQLRKDAKPLDTPAGPAVVVDLLGPESAGAKRERTLGAILPHEGASWFIKLSGPAELVGKQQAAFESFVRSLRFGAAPGAKE